MSSFCISGHELRFPPEKMRMCKKFKKGGKKKYLSNAEIEEIKQIYPDHFNWQLAVKFNVHESTILSIRRKYDLRKSEKIMQEARYKKGRVPWNRGEKGRYTITNSGQFRKGNIPANSEKDGNLSIRKSKTKGEKYYYIRIKAGTWILYHRYLYELKHDKIPEGYIVRFKDGNTLNCKLENLELVSRKENMERNRNRKKAAQAMRETWESEKLRVKYSRPQQTKLQINNK